MDDGDGRNREGIGRLHEDSSQSAVFAKHVTEFPWTAPPR